MGGERTFGSEMPEVSGISARVPHRELVETIIGAAFEVQNQLGQGFLDQVYAEALKFELDLRGAPSKTQAPVKVMYKGRMAGEFLADIVVDNAVICVIKVSGSIRPEHEAEMLNYLKATGYKIGVLLNFGSRRLQVRRMVH